MQRKNIQSITAEIVVEDAKSEDTPYHDYFEWDNEKAGHQWRLVQARGLVRSINEVKIIREENNDVPIKVRLFHDVKPGGYTPNETVWKVEEMREQVIQKALRELRGWSNRYRLYTELAEIHKAVDNVQLSLLERKLESAEENAAMVKRAAD